MYGVEARRLASSTIFHHIMPHHSFRQSCLLILIHVLANDLQVSIIQSLCLLGTETGDVHHRAQLVYGHWRFELKSSCLQIRCYTD